MADEADTEDILNVLEDIAEGLKSLGKATRVPEIRPTFNVPTAPAPALPAPQVTVKAPQVTVPPSSHPFPNGFRVLPERDPSGNVSEYRFLPL